VDSGSQTKNRNEGGDIEAAVEGVHRVFFFLRLHHGDANDAGDEIDGMHNEREENSLDAEDRIQGRAENHGADVFRGGGLKDVRATTGAVAYVVPDQVSDDGRIAWVVFGDAGFHFADQVRAHVRGLGIDAAAELGEERHQRCAKSKTNQLIDNMLRMSETTEEEEEHTYADE